jgi:hypothetical protein
MTISKEDPEVVEAAWSQLGDALYYAHENLGKDPGMVENMVIRDGPVSINANVDHKKDWEVVTAALDQNGMALQ